MVVNHYQILGVPEDADLQLIKSAYRSMAKRFHPDTNQGSEAAAELFRQLNEAYRILSDRQLRESYDRKIAQQKQTPATPRGTSQKRTGKPDPQQKFNNFLYSVLGAILEMPEAEPAEPPRKRTPPPNQSTRNRRRKPDFDFYYYLAKERDSNPYSCGEDGIYRRKKSKPRQPSATGLVLLLLASCWQFLTR